MAQDAATAGPRIVDVIAELREQGIVVIYSDELLTGDMRAQSEPAGSDPIERLRGMLLPHGLMLETGPRGSWLVVRSADESAAEVAPPEPGSQPAFTVAPPTIEEVVVSASRYAIYRAPGTSTSQIDRLQLQNTPTLGEDALRVTHGLPGLTSSGLSAQVNIRGGTSDEALLFLDGVELFNPFHLKDFQSIFSSINPGIVDSMTVYTGAFPAQFGNRMSGVIEMRTITPEDRQVHELGASLLTTSLLSAGSFANGRGTWVTSLRRGNLDLLIDAADSDLGHPGYSDLYGKLSYDINADWVIGAGFFALDDDIALNDSDSARASAGYDDTYLWLRADYAGDKLSGNLLLSGTALIGNRQGDIADPDTSTGALMDEREFDSASLKADWTYRFNDRHLLSWGAELRRSTASYRFEASRSDYLPISIAPPASAAQADLSEDATFEGEQKAVYVSYRMRPLSTVTAEIGLRWDDQDYLGDSQLSPRLNVLFDLGPHLKLRTSWGRYFQAQRLDEVQVNNGSTSLFRAQASEHYVVGLEYLFGDGTSVRLEAYRKEIERLHPRNENLFARVSLLPELLPDRVMLAPSRGRATGLELSADGERGRWRWWASLSKARTFDFFAEMRAARSWEEPWSLKGGAIRAGDVWNLAITTNWHSGWPISSLTLVDGELRAGTYNNEPFGEFGSVDLRVSRPIRLERSELEWYVSLINVFARDNPCCIAYDVTFDASGRPAGLDLGTDSWLTIVPNIGITWRFSPEPR